MQCHQKSPDKRPASAIEVAEALEKATVQADWSTAMAAQWWARFQQPEQTNPTPDPVQAAAIAETMVTDRIDA